MPGPVIGVTADVVSGATQLKRAYTDMVAAAGGVPVVLPASADLRAAMLDRIDGLLITGGDDIDVSRFGVPLHPEARCMAPERQDAEFAVLDALAAKPDLPVLGICLGMQLMGMHRGNPLVQHLADVLPDAARHQEGAEHPIEAAAGAGFPSGPVRSYHHQALAEARGFEILAVSDDGVIEAIRDPARRFFLGVQWHPERTEHPDTGLAILRLLVDASR